MANPSGSAVPSSDVIRLDRLPVGVTAAVVRMDEADHVMMLRLKTMGMHEGRAVRMVRSGSRVIVQCAGTRMGLAAEVAGHVLVKPVRPQTRSQTRPQAEATLP